MKIVGDKVVLRAMEGQDNDMLQILMEDQKAQKVIKGYACPLSCRRKKGCLSPLPHTAGSMRNIIADKRDPQAGLGIIFVSHMDFENKTAEIHIKLLKSARGNGYGRDAVNTLVSYAFGELGLSYIYGNILEHNIPSRRLFETCGFKQEGMHPSKTYQGSRPRNVCCYGIKGG